MNGKIFSFHGLEDLILLAFDFITSYKKHWITTDNKTPELTKRPYIQRKNNPQRDDLKGRIMSGRANSISAMFTNHKFENSCTTEVPPQKWKFWASHESSQAGALTMDVGTWRYSGFESQQGLIAVIPYDWGTQKLHTWRVHKLSCALGPRLKKAVNLWGTGTDLLASLKSHLQK